MVNPVRGAAWVPQTMCTPPPPLVVWHIGLADRAGVVHGGMMCYMVLSAAKADANRSWQAHMHKHGMLLHYKLAVVEAGRP